jgi:protein-L-isoaspartate(D-aspartate) O-methyltransferase
VTRSILVTLLLVISTTAACKSDKTDKAVGAAKRKPHTRIVAPDQPFERERRRMVDETIAGRGITDERVLEVMRYIPRHEFVPPEIRDRAYDDSPQQIGFGLTISQPYIVALMTQAAKLAPGARVLEIGTGSGYQAAVLAELDCEVYTMEIVEPLAKRTQEVLRHLGYNQIQLEIGDGYFGWPKAAPFDAILVTTAPSEIPPPLIAQLAVGGHMVIPVGVDDQQLEVLTKGADGVHVERILDVRFGPMIGEAQRGQLVAPSGHDVLDPFGTRP